MAEPGRPDWRNPAHLLAFGLGSGAVPLAPGTAGTLAALPLYGLLAPLPAGWYLLACLLLFAVGVPLCGRVAADLGSGDPGGIVWDEWVGLLVTLWLVPPGWPWLVAGLVLFRLFDILKPWPVGWVDRRVGGGLGIMLDDLVAGLWAFLVIQAAARLLA